MAGRSFFRASSAFTRCQHRQNGGSFFSDVTHFRQLLLGKDSPLRLQQLGSDIYEINRIMSSCAKSESPGAGVQFHPFVIKLGLSSNVYICSTLITIYGKCGRIMDAHNLFDELPFRNVVTWNSLTLGYLRSVCLHAAVDSFEEMRRWGVRPTPFSVSIVLDGCTQLVARALGWQLHGLIYKLELCCNVVVGAGLINMYSKCSRVDDASKVFERMLDKNVIAWTSMVSGHAHNHQPREAMVLVREMLQSGLQPNYVTYNSLLSSFCSGDHLIYVEQVHSRVIRDGVELNPYIAVTLVKVYSECKSSLEDFEKLCSSIMRWDKVAWNAVIAGYTNLGNGKDALSCFMEMQRVGIELDSFTFTSALKGARVFSGLKEGNQLHGLISKTPFACLLQIQNGLVSMYASCGMINDAKKVFFSIEDPDVVSWNALISGCAHHGLEKEATDMFDEMRRTSITPDANTFLAVLTACSHVGLVQKGLKYFEMMRTDCTFEPPKLEHYATVVNLLGRAGNLHEAEAFINRMPIEPGPSVYKALLSSCHIHGNKETAERIAKKLLKRFPDDPATYVLLSNVREMGQNWVDATEMRVLMCDRRIKKSPGFSWI